MTNSEARVRYLAGELGPFDCAASISSIEHSGLGRYGDQLNPWGDLVATAKLGCLLAIVTAHGELHA